MIECTACRACEGYQHTCAAFAAFSQNAACTSDVEVAVHPCFASSHGSVNHRFNSGQFLSSRIEASAQPIRDSYFERLNLRSLRAAKGINCSRP
jgi:hypothetical protein